MGEKEAKECESIQKQTGEEVKRRVRSFVWVDAACSAHSLHA